MADADATYAQAAIANGSQSFAAAARLFDPEMRRDVVKLYAWCRYCDDVIDDQLLGFSRRRSSAAPSDRLVALRRATIRSLAGEKVDHPAFFGLGELVARHAIPHRLPLDHLAGFELDVRGATYRTLPELLHYCSGVAGVVGVMMAHIMGVRDERMLHRACDLGLAFQLTNIARDVRPDAESGRVYLPLAWLEEAGLTRESLLEPERATDVAPLAARLVQEAEPYYASARIGLSALPPRAAWAVSTALRVYRAIGLKVKAGGIEALRNRVRTTRREKLVSVLYGAALAARSRGMRDPGRNPALFRLPALAVRDTA